MAEAEWAPPDDPVFRLVPPDFESYVAQCFKDLGEPEVNFDTFWDVYHGLRDLVEITVPDDVVVILRGSVMMSEKCIEREAQVKSKYEGEAQIESEYEGEVQVESEDEGEMVHVDFTNEEGRDELF